MCPTDIGGYRDSAARDRALADWAAFEWDDPLISYRRRKRSLTAPTVMGVGLALSAVDGPSGSRWDLVDFDVAVPGWVPLGKQVTGERSPHRICRLRRASCRLAAN